MIFSTYINWAFIIECIRLSECVAGKSSHLALKLKGSPLRNH